MKLEIRLARRAWPAIEDVLLQVEATNDSPDALALTEDEALDLRFPELSLRRGGEELTFHAHPLGKQPHDASQPRSVVVPPGGRVAGAVLLRERLPRGVNPGSYLLGAAVETPGGRIEAPPLAVEIAPVRLDSGPKLWFRPDPGAALGELSVFWVQRSGGSAAIYEALFKQDGHLPDRIERARVARRFDVAADASEPTRTAGWTVWREGRTLVGFPWHARPPERVTAPFEVRRGGALLDVPPRAPAKRALEAFLVSAETPELVSLGLDDAPAPRNAVRWRTPLPAAPDHIAAVLEAGGARHVLLARADATGITLTHVEARDAVTAHEELRLESGTLVPGAAPVVELDEQGVRVFVLHSEWYPARRDADLPEHELRLAEVVFDGHAARTERIQSLAWFSSAPDEGLIVRALFPTPAFHWLVRRGNVFQEGVGGGDEPRVAAPGRLAVPAASPLQAAPCYGRLQVLCVDPVSGPVFTGIVG